MRNYQGMQYKTRGDASPQGRPKVCLCCAAEDFDRLFEPVSEEILSIQPNAAVWFADPGASREGDAFLADLSQMQLLVVPVTSAFLMGKDPARTVAFAYALEHHIPVLPLLQEPGLEESFNKICGSLECLSPFAERNDPTAASYEEKIRRFLQAVLVSDELAGRVRAAFDAYIFLSYRKKDRAAAQQIMRLIHENEFCRDVAIWYDEFLTPGENFNSAIAEAMEKSALFALVVTPSLLEDPNYVLTTEYPAARRLQKPILPLEAEDTDLAELQRLYDGIAQRERTDEPAAVTARLRGLLSDLALRQHSDPTHTFLIGIAYLSGVDVEVNHARAAALITEAAEAGLPEALEKLVSMYQTGEGVQRDYRTAVRWQRKLVEARRAEAEAAPEDAKLEACFLAMEDLGRYQLDVAYPQYALKTFQEQSAIVDALEARQHPMAQTFRARCCRGIGSACIGLGEMREGLDWYRKSSTISARLAEELGDDESLRQQAEDEHQVGTVFRHLSQPIEAASWFQKEIAHRQTLAASGSAADRRKLSEAYDKMAFTCRDMQDLQTAMHWDRENLKLSEALVRDFGETQDRRMLSDCYYGLARNHERSWELQSALELYQECLTLRQALAQETGALEDRRMLILILNRIGSYYLYSKNDAESALKWLQKAVDLCEPLTRKTGTVQMRFLLASVSEDLSDAYERLHGKTDSVSTELAGRCIKLYQMLADNPGTVEAKKGLARRIEHSADASIELSQSLLRSAPELWPAAYPGAKKGYLEAYSIQEQLRQETEDPRTEELAHLAARVCEVCLRMEETQEAEKWYQKAIALIAEMEEPSRSQSGAAILARIGQVYAQLGQLSEAEQQFLESVRLMRALVSNNPAPRYRRLLCTLCREAGLFFRNNGQMQKAETQFRAALEVIEPLARETGDADHREQLWLTELNLFSCTNLPPAERLQFLSRLEADASRLDDSEKPLRDKLLRTVEHYRASLNTK